MPNLQPATLCPRTSGFNRPHTFKWKRGSLTAGHLGIHVSIGEVVSCTQPYEQVATCSKCCSISGHRDWKIRAWSVSADAWRPALAGCSSASAVQACYDSSSLSSPPNSMVPRRLPRASLRSSCQLSVLRVRRSTFGTRSFSVAVPTVWKSLPDHLRDPAVDSRTI